jgi:cytochrome c peroxidase
MRALFAGAAACAALAAALAAASPSGGAAPEYDLTAIASRWEAYESPFESLALSPDGARALTGSRDGTAALWDAAAGKRLRVLKGHRGTVPSTAFSPDGARLLTGAGDGTLRLWDAATGKPLRTMVAGGGEVFSAVFSPDGARALSADHAGELKLWRLEDGALLKDLGPGRVPIPAAAFAGDGSRAVTVELGNTVSLWDLSAGTRTAVLRGAGPPAVGRVAAADRASFLLTGEALERRDAVTGALLASFPQAPVTGDAGTRVAFSPDGAFILAEGARQRLNLWDARTGRLLRSFVPPGHVRGAAFSPDGKRLYAVFGGVDAVLTWPADPGRDAPASGSSPEVPPAGAAVSTAAAAELGRLLFFDARMSKDGLVSCATCHDPKKGWTDHRPVSIGVGGRKGRRRSLSLLNVAYHEPLFWDGRADTLEQQVHFPMGDENEMGSSEKAAERAISGIAGYRPYFARAFGSDRVDSGRIAAAIAAFERTLVSMDSPYDRYAAGDGKALSPDAVRGLEVFNSKGRCFMCHELVPAHHRQFYNIGVNGEKGTDVGRYAISKDETDLRAFRVPDLHNLKYTAPYMHDGSLKTLAEVVDFYDRGGEPDPRKVAWVQPLGLTAREKADLVAFLESLSGDPLAQDPPPALPK